MIHKFNARFQDITPPAFDILWTSPPYKKADGFNLPLIQEVGEVCKRHMKPDAIAFINFGQLQENFSLMWQIPETFSKASGLSVRQSIIWVKSTVVDGLQRGHFQPINSERLLNYCWEIVFVFSNSKRKLNRLALGVPYADENNLKRGNRGSNGNLHCRGDVWVIPYETTGSGKKKAHVYEAPEELVSNCLKLACVNDDPSALMVFDPFSGSGTTSRAATKLGMSSIYCERDPDIFKSYEEGPVTEREIGERQGRLF